MTRSGRIREYAFRCAAQLGVIVLGVTIALWADDWAAKRKDRATEASRLGALKQNVENTLENLRAQREDAIGSANALRTLLAMTDPDTGSEEIRNALLYGFFFSPAFTPELNVYDDLKNSGELGLLTDPALRQALSAMETSLNAVTMSQQDMATVQQLNFDPYLLNRIDLRPILGIYLDLPEFRDAVEFDAEILNSVEFRNLALFKLDLVVNLQEVLNRAEEDLRVVDRLISRQ